MLSMRPSIISALGSYFVDVVGGTVLINEIEPPEIGADLIVLVPVKACMTVLSMPNEPSIA